jgi:N-methylhydantoinase A
VAERTGTIGVDVGGTHTDVAVLLDGRVVRGKALTTYDDFSKGLIAAVEDAAGNLDLTLAELLARTEWFVNGTTVVTNTITELRGSTVGVLVTAGFKDTFRFASGVRSAAFDDHLNSPPPDLFPRAAIAEIDERIDWAGEVVIPLDLDQVRAEARRLVEQVGVEAFAVCFLSSFANPEHELAAEAALRELYPDRFVTPSHRALAVAGETRRFTTAVLNSFVHQHARDYLEQLSGTLVEAGLAGRLTFFQGVGGSISPEKAAEFPLALLGSGPAAGAIGANELARRMGRERVLLGDMGGTSFDTGIVVDNEIHVNRNLQLGHFRTGVNVVDVVSVGAGGGSIGWVSERGVPQVGPASAGSTPGPAALDRGGTDPTVTDAMVALGFIDPDGYLGGRIKLRPELARAALERVFGERFGWDAEEAAAAVHDLVVVNMANAVREVSVEKGHDPRDFLFLAYGGTLPMFAAAIARRLGIGTVVVPQNSSVFCALGLVFSNHVLRDDQAVGWSLDDVGRVGEVEALLERMVGEARAAMEAEGFAGDAVSVARSADFRFQGQDYQLAMPLPDRPLEAADAEALSARFLELYERTYGEGTAWRGVPTSLVNATVTAVGHRPTPEIVAAATEPAAPTKRSVYLPGERRREEIAIYAEGGIGAGERVEGPAIVALRDTTIYVPPATTVSQDEHRNYVLEIGQED